MQNRSAIGLLLLRLFLGARLFYGVIDNAISWDKMKEFAEFLSSNHFPMPLLSAIISVSAQLICSIMILIGWQTKIASLIMVFNFLVALIAVHFRLGDSIEGMTPVLAMFFCSLTLFFTGPGEHAINRLHT